LCRYSYGSDRCAHRLVVAGICSGERNCLERVAPSYYSRASAPRRVFGMPEHRDFRTGAFVDLHLVDLGSPLTAGGQ
jgi:hypothetical protein